MTGRVRKAFTIVELLVVIVIIGILVAMVMPAINVARENAKQAKCKNNLHELALAAQQFDSKRQYLPGYINRYGTITAGGTTSPLQDLSWATMLLPFLGQMEIWEDWTDQPSQGSPPLQRKVDIEQLKCPSGRPTEKGGLSYVANCGLSDQDYQDTPHSGVFHNHNGPKSNWIRVSASSIADGAQNTLLFSESYQANVWWLPDPDNAEKDVGMVWWPDGSSTNRPACSYINECRDTPSNPSIAPDITYARPSSFHPGIVIAVFCDGSVKSINEDMEGYVKDYLGLQSIMIPRNSCFEPDPNNPSVRGCPPGPPLIDPPE